MPSWSSSPAGRLRNFTHLPVQAPSVASGVTHRKHPEAAMAIDTEKLNAFLGKFVADFGATFHAGEVVTAGGFTRFRRATETPFNLIFEARP
jgi:2-keto-4-pentenoate hydratase